MRRDPERVSFIALALRLKRLPSELAAQLSDDEWAEMLAFAQIEREELDKLHNPGGPDGIQETRTADAVYRSAEGAGAYNLLASMVATEPAPPSEA